MASFRPRALRRMEKDELLAGVALGFFMFCGYVFQTAGLLYTTPAKSGFVTGSSVVLVPLLLGIFWGKKLTALDLRRRNRCDGWLVFSHRAGRGNRAFESRRFADVCGSGVLCNAHYFGRRIHSRTWRGGAEYFASCGMCVAGVVRCRRRQIFLALNRRDSRSAGELFLGIAVCAIFATAVAFSIQLWAQQYTTSSHAAIIFTLEPVFAVITSYLVIAERLTGRSIFGAFFVLAGIFIAEMFGPPAAPESPEPVFAGRIYFEPWWWQ